MIQIKNVILRYTTLFPILMLSSHLLASSYNIGSSSEKGTFGKLTELLQKWIDFMTGPYAKAAIAGILIVGVIAWAYAPREGIVGVAIRALVAGVVVVNIAAWMSLFGG